MYTENMAGLSNKIGKHMPPRSQDDRGVGKQGWPAVCPRSLRPVVCRPDHCCLLPHGTKYLSCHWCAIREQNKKDI